eukprot:scaffold70672_cov26-Tisochrysis_lutea.AAC.2
MSSAIAPPVASAADLEGRPFVDGRKVLCNGKVTPWDGAVQEVFAPIFKVCAGPFRSLPNALPHSLPTCGATRDGFGFTGGGLRGEDPHRLPGSDERGGLAQGPRRCGRLVESWPRLLGRRQPGAPHRQGGGAGEGAQGCA